MENKRAFGVALTGWGLVICAGFFLIQPFCQLSRLTDRLFNVFYAPLQLVWLISSFILIGFVVGGWQLLKRKEFGRSLVVFLAIIDIPHLVVGKAIYNNYSSQPMYIRNFFLIIVSVAIDLAIIVFLNHPKVKAQFG